MTKLLPIVKKSFNVAGLELLPFYVTSNHILTA